MANFFRVELIGAESVNRQLNRFNLAAQNRVKDVVNESAMNIRNNAVQSMSDEKHGRFYTTYNRRIRHRASAPGEAPATDTSRLKNSIRVRFYAGGLAADIGTDVPYGSMLEHGTRHIAPRPWLYPSWESERPEYIRKLREALRDATR